MKGTSIMAYSKDGQIEIVDGHRRLEYMLDTCGEAKVLCDGQEITVGKVDGKLVELKEASVMTQSSAEKKELFFAPSALIANDNYGDDYWSSAEAQSKIRQFADSYLSGLLVAPVEVDIINSEPHIVDGAARKRGMDLAISEGWVCPRIKVVVRQQG